MNKKGGGRGQLSLSWQKMERVLWRIESFTVRDWPTVIYLRVGGGKRALRAKKKDGPADLALMQCDRPEGASFS